MVVLKKKSKAKGGLSSKIKDLIVRGEVLKSFTGRAAAWHVSGCGPLHTSWLLTHVQRCCLTFAACVDPPPKDTNRFWFAGGFQTPPLHVRSRASKTSRWQGWDYKQNTRWAMWQLRGGKLKLGLIHLNPLLCWLIAAAFSLHMMVYGKLQKEREGWKKWSIYALFVFWSVNGKPQTATWNINFILVLKGEVVTEMQIWRNLKSFITHKTFNYQEWILR